MRILVETGDYDLRNLGDIAMLQVAVSRLHTLWPTATLQVVTRSPERLSRFCPYATPLTFHAASSWYKQSIRSRLYRSLPACTWQVLDQADHSTQTYLPSLARLFDVWNASLHGDKSHLFDADLVVAVGGGYLTDSFEIPALLVLDTLAIAVRLGKPIALFGQGLGPWQQPALAALARHVFPRASLVALRENLFSRPLIQKLGIPAERVVVTGDDAISLAYDLHQKSLGQAIGVNLRVAAYAEINASLIKTVGTSLRQAAKTYNAALRPIPIALGAIAVGTFGMQSDLESIHALIGESQAASMDGYCEQPTQVIEQIADCRIVVTGSYHGAVFALAQGIPAVCLAKSEYYRQKFHGLADQFGAGCEVLILDDADLDARLAQAIDHIWQTAEAVRPQLLAAAQKQVRASQQAYEQLFSQVSARLAGMRTGGANRDL